MKLRLLSRALLAFAALVGSAVSAQEKKQDPPAGLQSWLEDHAAAAKQAKEQGKLILVDLYTDWCGWCKKLEQDTYPAAEVQEVLKGFVLLKINPEKEAFGKELMQKAGARGFPATVIVDADWNVVRFISGYKDPAPYAEEVRNALKAHRDFLELLGKVKAGEADYETLYKFLKACDELSRKEEIKAHGAKGLEKETGEHHSDIAYFIAKAFGPEAPEFAKYKDISLKHDPENALGHHDDFVLEETMRVLNSGKTKEEMPPLFEKAIGMLEARTGQAKPALHREKGQTIWWVLAQLHLQGRKDTAKAVELLKRGIALNPETPLAKRMGKVIEQLGG